MSNEFDAVIVLGCGVNKNGSLPNDSKESVDIAADLYRSARASLIIFSGDLSYKADFEPPHGESVAMWEYARQIGLPPESLFQEDKSKDTLGNAYFTKIRYLVPKHLRNLAIVLGPNQSAERVQYIFNKVLGDQYTATFFEHNAHRPSEAEREAKSLAILKEWLDKIPNGDHDAMYRIMLTKHPGYKT